MTFVVDASVFNKLFLNESDSAQARGLFHHSILNDIQLLAPGLLLYEALSVALHYEIPFGDIHQLLALQRAAGMRLIEPTITMLETAQTISRHGNSKSGYPSLQDSIYHAVAIEEKAVLVTADAKHFSKAGSFGNIKMLDEIAAKLES
ncbi:MAG: type II toxin-antitoxin system VapC family toxin [Rhizobiaceae bacterium]|nr:type II toxin-antitoxin system VapC family toxin [Rhizobiaceae bacterium]